MQQSSEPSNVRAPRRGVVRWAQGLAGLAVIGVVVSGYLPVEPLEPAELEAASCPAGMVSVGGKFCIDKYEASTEEINAKGKTIRKHSPYKSVAGVRVKAVSVKGRIPQGYISRDEAEEACENAGKRLCTDEEWITACKGKDDTKYPYGDDHEDGNCNDSGTSSFNLLYGPGGNKPPEASVYTRENMNDERLNQVDGTVAPSGKFSKCKSSYGAFDMVGNLHEWTEAPAGTFRGGYYLDTHINGDGCDYRTTAHDHLYHDYSTGFRCCADPGGKHKAKKKADTSSKSDDKKKDDAKADDSKTVSKKKPSKKKKKKRA